MKRAFPLIALFLLGCAGSGRDDPPDAADVERIQSLPYITRPAVREEFKGLRGVVLHRPEKSHPGLNLYGSMSRDLVLLRDMDGQIVHRWDASSILSQFERFPLGSQTLERVGGPPTPGVAVAELHGEDLYIIESLDGIARLGRDSTVKFVRANNAHHDLDVTADGRVYVLTAAPREIDLGRRTVTIIDDQIEILAPSGEPLERHSIFEILAEHAESRPLVSKRLEYAAYWFEHLDQWFAKKLSEDEEIRAAQEKIFDLYRRSSANPDSSLERAHYLYLLEHTPADILHSNTLQFLPKSPWGAGVCLVSVRELNLVAVLDLEEDELLWSWGPGELDGQHQPTLLPNGNILLFDNGTRHGSSRILEISPAAGDVVWSYGGSESQRFFCGAMGGVQKLANGNVLVTDSGAGRAFELTRSGERVWDFFNPDRGFNPFGKAPEEETIEAIYRMTRIDEEAWNR